MDFALMFNEGDATTVVYFDDKRSFAKKESGRIFVVSCAGGSLSERTITFSPNSTAVWVFPNRAGFLTVVEYDKNSRRLTAHTESTAKWGRFQDIRLLWVGSFVAP